MNISQQSVEQQTLWEYHEQCSECMWCNTAAADPWVYICVRVCVCVHVCVRMGMGVPATKDIVKVNPAVAPAVIQSWVEGHELMRLTVCVFRVREAVSHAHYDTW